MKITCTFILLFFVYGASSLNPRSNHGSNCQSQFDVLTDVYNLTQSKFTQAKRTQIWQSNTYVCDNKAATSYFLVYNEVCGSSRSWITLDKVRLYIWHGGKALIDIIDEDNNLNTVCIGATTEDEDCRYMVVVPAGSINDFRVDDYVIVSAVVIPGTSDEIENIPYHEMLDRYPQHENIIKLTDCGN